MSTRRDFLKQMGVATAGLAVSGVPTLGANAATKKEKVAQKSDKVNEI